MTNERELEGLLGAIRAEPAEPLHRFALADWLTDNPDNTSVPLTPDFLRQFTKPEPMSRTFFGKFCGEQPPPPSGDFMTFADILNLEGRAPYAELVRAGVRSWSWLTDKEKKQHGVEGRLIADLIDNEFTPALRTFLGTELYALYEEDPHRITFTRGIIRDMVFIETTISALPSGLQVLGDIAIMNAPIAALPDGLHVGRDLVLSETSIQALPKRLLVEGGIFLHGADIKSLPVDLQVGGDIDLTNSKIEMLPDDLQVAGNLNLSGTKIKSLPISLKVGGDLNLTGIEINQEEATRIRNMPGLSDQAKVTGLRSAGYEALAMQVERRAAQTNTGTGLPPL